MRRDEERRGEIRYIFIIQFPECLLAKTSINDTDSQSKSWVDLAKGKKIKGAVRWKETGTQYLEKMLEDFEFFNGTDGNYWKYAGRKSNHIYYTRNDPYEVAGVTISAGPSYHQTIAVDGAEEVAEDYGESSKVSEAASSKILIKVKRVSQVAFR